jgi:His-Xaa-Ser system protein HxsD
MANAEGCSEAALIFHFSSDVFSLDTIKRAAYKYTDNFSFEFVITAGQIECTARPLASLSAEDGTLFKKRFHNEVLDQDLRRSIAEETGPMRNAILAHAFSKTGLQQVE